MKSRQEDIFILKMIKEVLSKRPTYGYRRVTAMVNQKIKNSGKRYNKKRIYRIMKAAQLLLPKSKVERKHTGTGKIITKTSNQRWCSDCFEIKCFNGEKVYVSFILDCHDRECISVFVSKFPITKKDIKAMMLDAVEKRFKQTYAPRKLEFLSDRGSIYRSQDTINHARYLNLKSCFTAAYSPSSNGMAESFVKTIKRDYVYVNDCKSAESTIKQLKNWIEDYNENAPHSGLKMMSPRNYMRNKILTKSEVKV